MEKVNSPSLAKAERLVGGFIVFNEAVYKIVCIEEVRKITVKETLRGEGKANPMQKVIILQSDPEDGGETKLPINQENIEFLETRSLYFKNILKSLKKWGIE